MTNLHPIETFQDRGQKRTAMRLPLPMPLVIAVASLGLVSAAGGAPAGPWEKEIPEPVCTARHEGAMMELGGKLCLLGGRAIKPVEEYDARANAWRKLAPTPMEFHADRRRGSNPELNPMERRAWTVGRETRP